MPRKPFDADARARQRKDIPTRIGGENFYPVSLTNKVMREIRRQARRAQATERETAATTRAVEGARSKLALAAGKPLDELDRDEVLRLQDELASAEAKQSDAEDAQQEAQSEVLFGQLSMLLATEDGDRADPEFLEEHLDTRDAGPLMTWLMTEPEGDEDGGNAPTGEEPVEEEEMERVGTLRIST
jgi:hypothetical protein